MSILRRFVLLCFALPLCTGQSSAQTTGTCNSPLGEAYLDANNVRARILNTGGLFYRGYPYVYNVPRWADLHSIFAGGLWIGGQVDGQLRMAASRYGPWEYWAGPLSDNGNPPSDCDVYDRVYKVSTSDIELFESEGTATRDLAEWPTGLGAPTMDSNGNLIDLLDLPLASRQNRVIDLDSGERPAIMGDQSIWWIMNDRGNEHLSSDAPPLGIEVHGFAYAAASELEAIDNATLYRYRIRYRGTETVDNVYIGLYFDTDLGDFDDDYVGSDTLLGLGFTYNADDFDGDSQGYGTPPPALGVRLLEGPTAESDGLDNDSDGVVDEVGERLGMTNMMYFFGGGGVTEDPRIAREYYYYMQSRWNDGKHLTVGGQGRNFSDVNTNFAFPGDPVAGEFWSEINSDGLGTSNSASDRRFVLSAGPITLEPGGETDLSFAIVWARGTDYIDSVAELKKAADVVKAAFDSSFSEFPPKVPPAESISLLSPAKGMTNQPIDPVLFWRAIDDADTYTVEVLSISGIDSYSTTSTSLQIENLPRNEIVYWRVRGENTGGFGSWSDLFLFWTTDQSVTGSFGFKDFLVVHNAGGRLDPPEGAAADWKGFPGTGRPTDRQQIGDGRWIIATGMSTGCPSNCGEYDSFVARSIRNGWTRINPFDFEIRFTARGSLHYDRFDYNGGGIIDGDPLPFELWNIGISTPDDISDDIRLIPAAVDFDGDGWGITSIDHEGSSSNNDPSTDWFYWYEPVDKSPGSIGYDAWATDALAGGDPGGVILGPEIMGRMVLVNWNGGYVPDRVFNQEMPEEGTVFRLVTTGKMRAPYLAAPGYGSQIPAGEVSFYWNTAERDSVGIQISDRADYASLIIDSLDVEPGFTVPLDIGIYYWRVISQYSGASSSWTFEVAGGTSGVNSEADADLPLRYELFANYPNPFNSSTVIAFALPSASHVRLTVYDVLGRRIQSLRDGRMPPGHHQILFDARRLSSGNYFYTLQAEGFIETKMMILSR